jgi:hypothetical protein
MYACLSNGLPFSGEAVQRRWKIYRSPEPLGASKFNHDFRGFVRCNGFMGVQRDRGRIMRQTDHPMAANPAPRAICIPGGGSRPLNARKGRALSPAASPAIFRQLWRSTIPEMTLVPTRAVPTPSTIHRVIADNPSNALPFSGLGAAKPAFRFYADASAATRSAATACSAASPGKKAPQGPDGLPLHLELQT